WTTCARDSNISSNTGELPRGSPEATGVQVHRVRPSPLPGGFSFDRATGDEGGDEEERGIYGRVPGVGEDHLRGSLVPGGGQPEGEARAARLPAILPQPTSLHDEGEPDQSPVLVLDRCLTAGWRLCVGRCGPGRALLQTLPSCRGDRH